MTWRAEGLGALLPRRNEADGWRASLRRAFVEYNPLYFASALCILAGAFLVACGLPPDAFGSKLGIVATTEAYQFLLIGATAVLLRAGLRRPAALLGLTCLVFMLDIAMNGERLLSHVGVLSVAPGMRARRAVPASVALALLGPFKIWLLARVLRLRSAREAVAITASVLTALPLLPYLTELVEPTARASAYLAVSWLGAPLLAWACTPTAGRWTSAWAVDGEDPRLRRMARVAPLLVAVLFVAHGLVWGAVTTLPPTAAQAAPYLLVASGLAVARLAARRPRLAEFIGFSGGASTLAAAALSDPTTGTWPLAAMSLLAGAVLMFLVEAKGVPLFVPAAVFLFAGTYLVASGTAAPPPGPVWAAGLAAALVVGAVRHRDFRCLLGSALAVGAAVAAARPGPVLLSYGGLAAGAWLAVTSGLLFPALRRWLPFAATVAVLGLGAWMVWRNMPGIEIGYGGVAVAAAGAGFAFRRLEFQGAGLAAGTVLAGLRHGSWTPSSPTGWGALLLAAGFVLLSAGVAVNLLLARRESPRRA